MYHLSTYRVLRHVNWLCLHLIEAEISFCTVCKSVDVVFESRKNQILNFDKISILITFDVRNSGNTDDYVKVNAVRNDSNLNRLQLMIQQYKLLILKRKKIIQYLSNLNTKSYLTSTPNMHFSIDALQILSLTSTDVASALVLALNDEFVVIADEKNVNGQLRFKFYLFMFCFVRVGNQAAYRVVNLVCGGVVGLIIACINNLLILQVSL